MECRGPRGSRGRPPVLGKTLGGLFSFFGTMHVTPYASVVGPIGPLELGIILLLLVFFITPLVVIAVVLYLITKVGDEEAGQDIA